jgi:acyl carrier protein
MTASQIALANLIITGLRIEDMKAEQIDPDAPLFGAGLGLDSIDALELAVIVERQYGVRIADMESGKQAFASLAVLDRFITANAPAGPR